MTLLEYLLSIAPEGIFHQRHGVLSIDTTDFFNGWDPNVPIEQQRKRVSEILSDPDWNGKIELIQSALEAVTDVEKYHGVYTPGEEELARLNGIELRLDPGTEQYDTNVRRPYYRMRGKSVTPEQARDIIRRTDALIGSFDWHFGERNLPQEEKIRNGDYVGSMNFNQWWFMRNHLPTHYGWSHPSGLIGCNAITQKYPDFCEYLAELLQWKTAFPYLDLTIAVSWWDECPSYWRDTRDDYMEYPDFCENLEIGICTHDNVIEFLNPENAARRYLDYEARYGAADPKVYVPEYYQDRKLLVCNNDYLIRCLMDYGMTEEQAWELVRTEPEYVWADAKF